MDELNLRRAQKGDQKAFEALVTPYEAMIWRICWHYTGHTEDARDCAQEALLKAWRSLGAYRRDCALESWLYRICASVCLDFLRTRSRTQTEPLKEDFDQPDPVPPPDEQALQRQQREELRRAIAQLPDDMRTVLLLYALEKKRYEEIAEITGTAVGTVKSRLSRARDRLQEILSEREQSGKIIVQQSRGRDAE